MKASPKLLFAALAVAATSVTAQTGQPPVASQRQTECFERAARAVSQTIGDKAPDFASWIQQRLSGTSQRVLPMEAVDAALFAMGGPVANQKVWSANGAETLSADEDNSFFRCQQMVRFRLRSSGGQTAPNSQPS